MFDALDIKKLPKVLLHEHLDDGFRPRTVIDLSQELAYKDPPTQEGHNLAQCFYR